MNMKTGHLKSVVSFLLLLFAFNYLSAQDKEEDFNNILIKAYEAITTNPQEAVSLFEQVAKIQPSNIAVQKQLGYLYIQQSQTENALEKFLFIENAAPSDTNKLQIAYLFNSLNQNEAALTYFRKCIGSKDSNIQEKSQTAVIVLEQNARGQKFPWWGDVYAAPYYDSRFKASFGLLQTREGYYLFDDKSFSLFGSLKISGDTKSRSVTSARPSELFSDNALILGVGLRMAPFYGFITEIQSGIGVDLIYKGTNKKVKDDFRAVMTYGNGIYPLLATPSKMKFTFKPLADIYTSLGYYSRFHNGIGYGAGRAGARLIEWKTSALDLYVRLDVVRDTKRKYYNNIVEWGGGIRIIPDHSLGLSILAEFHRGKYYPVINSVLLSELYYNSFRLFIIFERAL